MLDLYPCALCGQSIFSQDRIHVELLEDPPRARSYHIECWAKATGTETTEH